MRLLHWVNSCEAGGVSSGRSPKAWLLMAAGDDRQHGGNTGYDDQADVYYSWDSTVNNYGNIHVGDTVAIWDKQRLLGVSVVEEIDVTTAEKLLLRCPNPACGRSGIKQRKTKSPRFRCQDCAWEFDEPKTQIETVTEYRSRHDAAWTSLEGLLRASELRELCKATKSQLSMRELDWAAFAAALDAKGADRAINRIQNRVPDFQFLSGENLHVTIPSGHSTTMVRVRKGQRQFRDRLLSTFGNVCAFTGSAPERVLDAGHLYSYASLGEHKPHGGLMLRKDVHRLFDDGWLAVHPQTLKVDVSDSLSRFPQYARLHGRNLEVPLRDEQVGWIEQHWMEHR